MVLLPNAVSALSIWIKSCFSKIKFDGDRLIVGFLSILVVIQITQLFTFADIYYSDSASKAAEYINTNFPQSSVAAMNSLDVSILLRTDKRFNIVEMTGMPVVGKNPLFRATIPEIIVSSPDQKFLLEGASVIDSRYKLITNIEGYNIYKIQ